MLSFQTKNYFKLQVVEGIIPALKNLFALNCLLIFYFIFLQMRGAGGSHYVTQASLKHLASSDSPTPVFRVSSHLIMPSSQRSPVKALNL